MIIPASGSPFSFQSYDSLPQRLQYADDSESRPPSVSYERNELRAVQAPTRFRVRSLLRYRMALGDSGMELRVRVKPKMRKIVKVELRF